MFTKTGFILLYFKTISMFVGLTAACFRSRTERARLAYISHKLGIFERKPQLPSALYRDILGKDVDVKLTNFDCPFGSQTVDEMELVIISAFVAASNPHSIVELGTYEGRLTRNLYLNSAPTANILTIDRLEIGQMCSDGKIAGSLIMDLVDDDKVTMLQADTRFHDFSALFGKQDFVVVDADHSYAGVKRDTEIALKMVRGRKACIIWHDYGSFPSVTQAVDETAGTFAHLGKFWHIKGTRMACLMQSPAVGEAGGAAETVEEPFAAGAAVG